MNPQKKLKLILASLKDRQIIKFFQAFSANFSDQIKKSVRQISFNCYQSVCQFKNKIVSGYGKNSQQSYVNSIRTLVQLLADDQKLHSVMRQSLRASQQSPSTNNCQSQKKLSYIQKQTSYSIKNVGGFSGSTKPVQKKTTLKQQIFEYLNRNNKIILVDNLKISNPNATHKTKPHEKYQNGEEDLTLQQVLKMNKQLEQKIKLARQQNIKLKNQIKLSKGQTQNQIKIPEVQTQNFTNLKQKQEQVQLLDSGESQINKVSNKQRASYTNVGARQSSQALKPRNDYLNLSQNKLIQKSKIRSVSVQAGQTQKYNIPKSGNEKKITVPKLNLQVLPNYHGKSNKSLNQSLMEVYEKTHVK